VRLVLVTGEHAWAMGVSKREIGIPISLQVPGSVGAECV
jgi:hypothetical protein